MTHPTASHLPQALGLLLKRTMGCAAVLALAGPANSQSDLGRALDIFNRIQRAAEKAQNAPPPAPAPSPSTSPAPARAPSAAPAPASPRVATPRPSDIEPPPGQYVITSQTKSKLAPGERIEHDPQAVPKRDPRWAASYENFVPPEAATRYADGPRSVVMELNTSHSTYGSGIPFRFKRVLSNPYIPTERVDLPNPNWVISPYYSQGFFNKIDAFSCRPDGTLFVRGEAGVPSDYLKGQTWARGIWRVEPDGKIMPFEVFPGSSYLKGGKHTCSTRTCGLPPNPPLERARAAGSKAWAQDKHGNVWGIASTFINDRNSTKEGAIKHTYKDCFVKRFNTDGSETVIQSNQDLCESPEGYNEEFINPPSQIAYNEALDEVFYVAGQNGGNTDGSWALFKANQAGQVTELLRNWQHSDRGSFGPNPPGKRRSDSNQVGDRWNGIGFLIYDPSRAAITFETSIFQASMNLKDPGRMYEIKDSFKTLKRLPYNSPAVAKNTVFGSDIKHPSGAIGEPRFFGDDQMLLDDAADGKFRTSIFGSSCFDDAGNRYFMNSSLSIRKMDPQGRLSTWVK